MLPLWTICQPVIGQGDIVRGLRPSDGADIVLLVIGCIIECDTLADQSFLDSCGIHVKANDGSCYIFRKSSHPVMCEINSNMFIVAIGQSCPLDR